MDVLSFLYPKTCIHCARWGRYLCADCVNFISLSQGQKCPQCNSLSVAGLTHPKCKKAHNMSGLCCTFSYNGLIKSLIAEYKYRFIQHAVCDLFELWISCLECVWITQNNWIVIPIPLHKKRKNWRGFNQSALLAKNLAYYLEVEYQDSLLIRAKKTASQMTLSKEKRAQNILGAFVVNSDYSSQLWGRDILLVDDVWTTGSTMKEASKVLLRSGAKSVWGIVLAS